MAEVSQDTSWKAKFIVLINNAKSFNSMMDGHSVSQETRTSFMAAMSKPAKAEADSGCEGARASLGNTEGHCSSALEQR